VIFQLKPFYTSAFSLKNLPLFFTLIFKSISFKSLTVSIHKKTKYGWSFKVCPVFAFPALPYFESIPIIFLKLKGMKNG
jgi:hypothetical protein